MFLVRASLCAQPSIHAEHAMVGSLVCWCVSLCSVVLCCVVCDPRSVGARLDRSLLARSPGVHCGVNGKKSSRLCVSRELWCADGIDRWLDRGRWICIRSRACLELGKRLCHTQGSIKKQPRLLHYCMAFLSPFSFVLGQAAHGAPLGQWVTQPNAAGVIPFLFFSLLFPCLLASTSPSIVGTLSINLGKE